MKHDWQQLQDEARGRLSDRFWVEAAERAIVQADPGLLASLFDDGLQPPAFLLPVIADALRAPFLPRPAGPKPKLTVHMTRQIAGVYDRLLADGMLSSEAVLRLADAYNVDERTIRRALSSA